MKIQQSGHLKHLGETPLVQFAESNGHNFILHQESSFMICSKTRAKASQRIQNQPQTTRQYFQNTALQSPPRNLWLRQKAATSVPRASKTTCQIFVANLVKTGTESPLISCGWKSLRHYVFFMFFHFSRTCFAHPLWKEFTGTLFLGLLVLRVPVFPLFGRL